MCNKLLLGMAAIVLALSFSSCSKSPDPSPVTPPTTNPPPPDPGNGVATFTLQSASANGTYSQGAALASSNTVTVQVNVTTAGTWSASTNTANGFYFSGAGTFTVTGIQSVTLAGSGTPAAAGVHGFTVTAGSSTCAFQVTTAPPCESCGITVIRGIKRCGINSSSNSAIVPNGLTTSDDFDGTYSLRLDLINPGVTVRTKLVNADKGTIGWKDGNPFYSAIAVSFTNVNNYNTAPFSNPDTTGKLQIWVYRADGRDIIPASNGKPAINKIVQVMGTLSAGDIHATSGMIILGYENNPWWFFPGWNPNAAYMTGLFAQTEWKLAEFNRRD